MSILGTRVVRTEDPRLLTTGATYVEDLRLPELKGETLLFPETGTNIAGRGGPERFDDATFDGCEAVVEHVIVNQRVAAAPLEVRAAAAAWADGRLTMWASTQNVHGAKAALAGNLGLAPEKVRVVTPDVGGGFGAKIGIDREAIAVGWAAHRTGRAVRWVETRNENLMAMSHGRAQRHTVTIGGGRDGRVRAYRLEVVQDCGAYVRMGTL